MNEQEIKDDIINYIGDVAVTDEQYDELLSERNHMIEILSRCMINEYKEQGPKATYQLMTALLKGTVKSYNQRTFGQLKTLYDHLTMNVQAILNDYDVEYVVSYDELNQEQKDYLSKKLEGIKDKNDYESFLISFLDNPNSKIKELNN